MATATDDEKETPPKKPAKDKAKAVEERNKRALEFAQDIAEAVDERNQVRTKILEIRSRLMAVKEELSDAENEKQAVEERLRHLVDLVHDNERGQLSLPFHEPKQGKLSLDQQSVTDEDAGGKLPIGELLKFGLSHSKFDQLIDSPYGDDLQTVADLEKLIAKTNGWFWKKVKGWGEKFATGDGENDFPNVHLRFREAHPVPGEMDSRQRRCTKCQHVFAGAKACPKCKNPFWVAIDDDAPPADKGPGDAE